MNAKYRIVKVDEGNFKVETRALGFWLSMTDPGPGFRTEADAARYIRNLGAPEIVAEFDDKGQALS